MASYNRVVLVGNVTRDPELRYVGSGTAVTDLGLAVNERVKRNDQWVEEVNFFYVTLWGRTAEVANEYLSKGSSVLIEGRLKHDRWEKDGQKFSKIQIVGEKMQMLGSRGDGGGGGGGSHSSNQGSSYQQTEPPPQQEDQYSAATSAPAPMAPPNDEIPF